MKTWNEINKHSFTGCHVKLCCVKGLINPNTTDRRQTHKHF